MTRQLKKGGQRIMTTKRRGIIEEQREEDRRKGNLSMPGLLSAQRLDRVRQSERVLRFTFLPLARERLNRVERY